MLQGLKLLVSSQACRIEITYEDFKAAETNLLFIYLKKYTPMRIAEIARAGKR